ncbi:hypothetical protein OG562_45115 [Streptomyces sp. NBC_01275]|uniref:hypothetical protein n=1 Tax=Streptomyces sp. NBC_01275 TaxID=2903807 RepID=UPI00224F4522|nr:hypothetical protein [Streptomyces sp. NBC_01275]MCX4767993.1 hypothetical protein [Streptomyces sp. NBC_01275]
MFVFGVQHPASLAALEKLTGDDLRGIGIGIGIGIGFSRSRAPPASRPRALLPGCGGF